MLDEYLSNRKGRHFSKLFREDSGVQSQKTKSQRRTILRKIFVIKEVPPSIGRHSQRIQTQMKQPTLTSSSLAQNVFFPVEISVSQSKWNKLSLSDCFSKNWGFFWISQKAEKKQVVKDLLKFPKKVSNCIPIFNFSGISSVQYPFLT